MKTHTSFKPKRFFVPVQTQQQTEKDTGKMSGPLSGVRVCVLETPNGASLAQSLGATVLACRPVLPVEDVDVIVSTSALGSTFLVSRS